jgi:hypothetical protein
MMTRGKEYYQIQCHFDRLESHINAFWTQHRDCGKRSREAVIYPPTRLSCGLILYTVNLSYVTRTAQKGFIVTFALQACSTNEMQINYLVVAIF